MQFNDLLSISCYFLNFLSFNDFERLKFTFGIFLASWWSGCFLNEVSSECKNMYQTSIAKSNFLFVGRLKAFPFDFIDFVAWA